MGEDVAVIDEVTDVHPTEVHEQTDAWDRYILLTYPERDFNHVRKLPGNGRRLRVVIDLEVVLRLDQEVDLVHVEFVVLLGYVLNDPLFHRSLCGHDRWRIVAVEQRWLLARAYLRNKELGRLYLAELEGARGRDGLAADPAKPLLAGA